MVSFFIIKVGTWNHKDGTNFTRNFTQAYSDVLNSLGNKTLTITAILVRVAIFTKIRGSEELRR